MYTPPNSPAVHTHVYRCRTNGEEVQGLFHQKLTPALDYGIQVKWNRIKNTSLFQVGCLYAIDSASTLKACLPAPS